MPDTIDVVVPRAPAAHEGASDLEIAIVAAQTRAGLARIREYVGFTGDDEVAFDRVSELLHGMIPDIVLTPR